MEWVHGDDSISKDPNGWITGSKQRASYESGCHGDKIKVTNWSVIYSVLQFSESDN